MLNDLSDVSSPETKPVPARLRETSAVDEALARVLIVDDNSISQLVTLQLLRQLDCSAQIASSGSAALEAVAYHQFDLIFLDCRMPGIDGYAAARAIRTLEKSEDRDRSTIIAITGDDDVECVDKCLSAGMDGHLSKPTSSADLRAILERCML